jgi:hypothetical protein
LANKDETEIRLMTNGLIMTQMNMFKAISKSLIKATSPNIVRAFLEDSIEEFKEGNKNG